MCNEKDRPPARLHHGALSVSDLERSVEFYNRVLGFKVDTQVTTEDSLMDIAHLYNGSDYLELFAHKNCKPLPDFAKSNDSDLRVVGAKHVAFETPDLEAFHKYLSELGVDGLTEIFDNNPYYDYFFFRDIDGIPIEIVRRRGGPAPSV